MNLRTEVIRLAHSNPKFRKDLLPLITRKASSDDGVQFFELGGLNWKSWIFDGYTLDQAKRDVKRVLTVVLAAKGDLQLRGLIDKSAVYSLSFNGLDADDNSFVISPRSFGSFLSELQAKGWSMEQTSVGRGMYTHPESNFEVVRAEGNNFIIGKKRVF